MNHPCEDCRQSCDVPCWKVDHGLLVDPPRWIPVTERLPELPDKNYCRTIVLAAATGVNSSFPAIYRRGIVRGKRVERWKYCWDKMYDGPAITHWMPLPEPPKEDNDG